MRAERRIVGARRLSEVRDPRGSDGEEGAIGGTNDRIGKRERAAGRWRRRDEAERRTVALSGVLLAERLAYASNVETGVLIKVNFWPW